MSRAWDLIHEYEEKRRMPNPFADMISVDVVSNNDIERDDSIVTEPAGHHPYLPDEDGVVRFVNISKERYDELVDAEKTLEDLYARGVDNWEGF